MAAVPFCAGPQQAFFARTCKDAADGRKDEKEI
jgi:hypothetical protein